MEACVFSNNQPRKLSALRPPKDISSSGSFWLQSEGQPWAALAPRIGPPLGLPHTWGCPRGVNWWLCGWDRELEPPPMD